MCLLDPRGPEHQNSMGAICLQGSLSDFPGELSPLETQVRTAAIIAMKRGINRRALPAFQNITWPLKLRNGSAYQPTARLETRTEYFASPMRSIFSLAVDSPAPHESHRSRRNLSLSSLVYLNF